MLDDYSDSISLLVDKPELGTLIEDISMRGDPEHPERKVLLNKENRVVFGYMLLNYSLFERVYLLYARKWIDQETWKQWHAWIKGMARHPMFQEVHHRSHGTFDTKFQALVEEAVRAGS